MSLTTISGEIQSQPLNDNFSYLDGKINDYGFINVKDYGAIGDGVTDDTTAIQSALNTGLVIFFPKGIYKITSTLNILLSGTRVIGSGQYSVVTSVPNGTVIISETSLGDPTFKVVDGLQHIEIENMTIRRTASATVGNSGILFDNNSNLCYVKNVEISKHWVGLYLGSTGFSKLEGTYTHDNYAHGVYLQNSTSSGSLQWQFENCLSQLNNSYGFFVESQANSVGYVTLGNMNRLNTYANTLGGIGFLGLSSTPVNGIRISDSFFGEDNSDEIYINTYGTSSHKINNTYIEASGTAPSGVAQATSASNTGNGINITSATYSVAISDSIIISNSYNGISSTASHVIVDGCDLRLNGTASAASTQIGVYINGGKLTMNGGKSMGQQYGVYLTNDNYHIIVGSRLQENTVAGLGAGEALVNTVDIGNIKT